jgi:hypothetical protein
VLRSLFSFSAIFTFLGAVLVVIVAIFWMKSDTSLYYFILARMAHIHAFTIHVPTAHLYHTCVISNTGEH